MKAEDELISDYKDAAISTYVVIVAFPRGVGEEVI